MSLPVVSATTQRIYDLLPSAYRTLDAITADYPLLRWIALLGEQAGNLETLLDRFSGNQSQLVNPATADPAWLPWLAQATGTRLSPYMTVLDQRTAIAGAVSSRNAGTRSSIIAVAQGQLQGSKFVQLIDHVAGNQWEVGIVTRPSETPQPSTVLSAILSAGVKPAGVVLTHTCYEASWATIEATLKSWALWESAGTSDPLLKPGSWGAIEETQLSGGSASWATIENDFPSWTLWENAGSWAAIEAASTTPFTFVEGSSSVALTGSATATASGGATLVAASGTSLLKLSGSLNVARNQPVLGSVSLGQEILGESSGATTIPGPPVITVLSNTTISSGGSIYISGKGFSAAQGRGYVTLVDGTTSYGAPGNATAISITLWADDLIEFVVPTLTSGTTASISVTTIEGPSNTVTATVA